jgi:hypothetical protein
LIQEKFFLTRIGDYLDQEKVDQVIVPYKKRRVECEPLEHLCVSSLRIEAPNSKTELAMEKYQK